MGGRFSYVFLSCALLAAALAAGVATWLEWLPCQGSMLNGSALLGYRYPTEFSDACLARMDGSDALPLGGAAVAARGLSALLLGLGWLWFAAGFRLPPLARALVLLPAVPVCWFGIASWLSPDAGSIYVSRTAMVAIELTALVAAVVIGLRRGTEIPPLPALIGLWAVASYGVVHLVGEYGLMAGLSDANWDTPPGTGYLTVAAMALCGLLVAVLGLRSGRAGPEPAQPSPDRPAVDALTG